MRTITIFNQARSSQRILPSEVDFKTYADVIPYLNTSHNEQSMGVKVKAGDTTEAITDPNAPLPTGDITIFLLQTAIKAGN